MNRIGVIGCGNMGAALIRGMLKARLVPPGRIVAWDSDRKKLGRVARSFGIQAAGSNREVAKAPVLLLAVKPQQMEEALKEIRPVLTRRSLLVSIAAGIPIRWIERKAGRLARVVRVMPNTPALVGAGMAALARGRSAGRQDLRTAEKLFRCVGETVLIPEQWLDAVTAVSGSGPAYFFFLMEQMITAGTRLGLSRQTARRLVLQTARGAAALAMASKEAPKVLRARVTSKGGTTEAAFRVFEEAGLGRILRAGIRAAAQRARRLSQGGVG